VIKIKLSDADAPPLERAFRQATDRTLADRLQILRLAQRGRCRPDIADDRGITPRTVPRWLNAYLDRGLDGPAAPQGQGPAAQDPCLLQRRNPPLGDRWPSPARLGLGQLDLGRVGRPPARDPGNPSAPLRPAALRCPTGRPRLPAHLPLSARRSCQAGGGPNGTRRAKKGRSEALQTQSVCPVADEHVRAVLPQLTPPGRAMVLVQRLTGMRPGEVVLMRPCDLDRRRGTTWVCRPESHKTEHHGA
jgi:hypothetical protein